MKQLLKGFLLTIIVILVGFPLMLGAFVGLSYINTKPTTIPDIKMSIMDQNVEPIGYEWYSPVIGGILHRNFSRKATLESTNIGTIDQQQIVLKPPTGYSSAATLSRGNKKIWSGPADELEIYKIKDNGRYLLEINCEKSSENNLAYGNFMYRISFKVQVEPRIEISTDSIRQGDVLAIRIYNIIGNSEPLGEVGEDNIRFVQTGEGIATGYMPVSYRMAPGRHSLSIKLGDYTWDKSFEVLEVNFPQQNATSSWWRTPVGKDPASLRTYADVIPSFYETADRNRYWLGAFSMPVLGEITTDYGALINSKGMKDPLRNDGIEILPSGEQEVTAPNSGRVVLAEQLAEKGFTVIIEHGGGLKSYFYHLTSLNVAEGNILRNGDKIGTAGNNNASQNTTIQYEVRIGRNTINPVSLFNGTSGLLFFEAEDEKSGEAKTRKFETPSSEENDAQESQVNTGW